MDGSSYEGPNEGFRGEVTRAAAAELKAYTDPRYGRDHCPSCGDQVTQDGIQKHAESCIELRSDVAENL